MRLIPFTLLLLASGLYAQPGTSIRIDASAGVRNISPFIYGKNNSLSDDPSRPLPEAEWQRLRDLGITLFRENGGNNSSRYNWRKKLGSHPDWYNNVYEHDWDFEAASLQENIPGAQGFWAFQLIGKAAKTRSANFNDWDYNRASYWEGVRQNLCGGGTVNPGGGSEALVEGDTSLYLENWPADSTIAILDHWFGEGGLGLDPDRILYWNMDNEPEIWSGTHDDIWPEQPPAEELVRRYIEVAKKARIAFPGIKLAGPVTANEWQWYNYPGGKITYEGRNHPFLEYFIRRVAEEEAASGMKLLDVLDIHFYPTDTDPQDIVQLHRVYFDREYDYPKANGVKNITGSWDNSVTKEYIFGRCGDWLEQYMGAGHGVTFGVSETGITSDDPGIVASWYASTLGEFARRGVELFTPWDWKKGMDEVINLFTRFGHPLYLEATSSEEEYVSAYPMISEAGDSLTVFIVNRHLSQSRETVINTEGFPLRDEACTLFQLSDLPGTETFVSKDNNALKTLAVQAKSGSLTLSLPPLSVSALVLKATPPDSEYGYVVALGEAEEGTLMGVTVASSVSGYSGTGYVTGFDNDNDRVSIPVEVPGDGTYRVCIRYDNSGDKKQMVSLNGAYAFPVDFPDKPGWALANAGIHSLPAGTATVEVIKDWGWTDIDRVELYNASETPFNISDTLVDPQADPASAALYEMLKLQFRHRIISGQTHSYFNNLADLAGRTPLLRAGDLSSYTEGYPYLWKDGGHTFGKDPDGTVQDLIAWHQETESKGIISFQWHWHSPSGAEPGQNNFYTSNTDFDVREAVTPGTPEYDLIIRDIDDIAAELGRFQDAGIPVLWRPLHEAGGGWFWWGAHGPEPCLELWDIIFERLMVHHGLHNLIWVWSTPEEDWYPGNEKVDIFGYDSYPGHFNYGNQKNAFDGLKEISRGEKLIAMTENGPIPDVDMCLDQGAPWLYFMSWSDLVVQQNSADHIKEVYGHKDVLTLESDNFRTGKEWRSGLYPAHWQPGYCDDQGLFLHDFSYAGYRGGMDSLPRVSGPVTDVTQPPYSADNTGAADVRDILQQALDDAGSAGGGVVYMPPGTYRISIPGDEEYGLHISRSNVILRGAGPDSTFLFQDNASIRQKEVIYMAPSWASWLHSGGNDSRIRSDLEKPTHIIPLESVSGYERGDRVVVRNTTTEAFIAEHGMTGIWTTQGIGAVAFLRTVDSVDAARKLLILDAPVRYPLKTRDDARVYRAKFHLEGCALEGFSVGNRESLLDGWGEEDYNTPGTGAWDAHFSQLIRMEYNVDSWIRNIRSYRPESNSTDVHMLSNALVLNMCRHITIDSCDFRKPQYEGGGGNGYMYCLQSNDCLIQNSVADDGRHNYDFKYPFSNGNVILNCRAENSRYSSDFHMYLSMANLFDRTVLNGDWLESKFRPWGGSALHGHSSTQSVFWNSVGEKYHGSKDYIVESRQYGHGYVIGTSGPAYGVKTDPLSGTEGGHYYDSSPRDFVEGVGEGADLLPSSLYLDQLEKRRQRPSGMQVHDLVVRVLDESGKPLEGAVVRVYGQEEASDALGEAGFPGTPESFFLEVEHPSYLPMEESHILIHRDTVLEVRLELNDFTVGFLIMDAGDQSPFWGIKVRFDQQEAYTDSEGMVSFTAMSGWRNYSFSKVNYPEVNDSLEVDRDTLLVIGMERSHADVKIRLREGTTPVNNVWVKLNEDSLISDGLGQVRFLHRPVGSNYRYTTFREGFEDRSGEFVLETDTTLEVAMSRITGMSAESESGPWIRLWPNPAKDRIHVQIDPALNIRRLVIRDTGGRTVRILEPAGRSASIPLSGLAPGIYFIQPGDRPERPEIIKIL